MIYRTDAENGKVHQPLDWKLYCMDRELVDVHAEEMLRTYLKNHPGEEFYLVPAPYMNREIPGATPDTFDPHGEHIRTGVVRYDSATRKIVTHPDMKISYTAKARQWSEGFAMLEQATAQLKKVLGNAAQWVTADWDRWEDEKGRSYYRLKVSDWSGEITASFTSDELRSSTHIRIRLYRLWGDELRRRSDAQHRKVEQLVSSQIAEGNLELQR
jgi:hypothetical protein